MRKSTLFLLLLLCGCSSTTNTNELLAQAEAQMTTAPDSALDLLRGIDARELTRRRLKARHALLLSQALDKNAIDLKSDSIIAPALAFYAHRGSKRERALMNYYAGRICDNAGNPGEAAKRMMEAEKHAIAAGETGLLGLIYNCRANLFYAQYSFDEAVVMYDKADSCFRLEGKMVFAGYMAKAKSKAYVLAKNDKAATEEARKAFAIFDSIGNGAQVCFTTSTLAYQMQRDPEITTDSIKRFLSSTYARYKKGVKPTSDFSTWAWIHLMQDNIDSAQYYIRRAIKESSHTNEQAIGLHSLAGTIAHKAKNYPQAAQHWEKAYRLLDSLSDHEKRNLIQHAEERYENKELQYQNEMLQLRSRLGFSIGALIFTILASAFVLTLRHWRRLMRRKSEENEHYRLFIDQLNDDYNSLKGQHERITQESAGNSEEANLLFALEKRLNALHQLLDLAYSGSCKPQAFYKEFKEYAASMNNNDFAFSDLQFLVNKRHNGIIDYLRRNHPALTNSELNMLSMMLFGFSFDCIRLIFNHENVDSIYSRRTKIREKLGLPPRSKIEKFMEELAERLQTAKNTNEEVNGAN